MSNTKTISKILRLKDNRKKEVELEVKMAREGVEAEQSKLLCLEKEYKNTLGLFNKRQEDGSLNATDIRSFYDYFLHINRMIRAQRKNYSQMLKELASLQDSLAAAHKDKKLFEILNGKAVRKEVRDKIISEQKESDFLSLSKKLRNS